MARQKSEFVKSFGTAFEIWKALCEEVFSCGGTDDDIRRILKDGNLRKEIAALIMPAENAVKTLPTWKTVKLGTNLRTTDDFCIAINQANMKIGELGKNILRRPAFKVASKETEVELVRVTLSKLGFADLVLRKEIYDRALELGLELCPSEVGPQLRLQYKDQPRGERVCIAMEPLSASDGFLSVFELEHDKNGVWLNGVDGRPGSLCGGVLVFARRK